LVHQSDNRFYLSHCYEKMNITLRQLRAFVAVAETGAFARAAERLHVSASGLSTLVRELEEQLGLRLFSRSTRVVQLTEGGAEFLPLARKTLNDLEAGVAASRSLAQVKRGRVSVVASIVLAATLLPWAIKGFKEKFPGIQLVLKDGFEEDIRDQVRRGEVDLGVGTLLHGEAGLSQSVLYEDYLVALVGDGHSLAEKGTVSWHDLASYPLICLSPRSPSRALADAAFLQAGVSFSPAYEASFSSTVISMVVAGLGVAALPVNVRQLSRSAGVQARLLVRPTVQRRVGIFARSDLLLSPAAAAFQKHLEEFVKIEHGLPAEVLTPAAR
jgi:DNA-binding transcriptional LysR family regulator